MTYLDRILAAHRDAAVEDRRNVEHLLDEARAVAPARDFTGALRAGEGLAVIAEIKR